MAPSFTCNGLILASCFAALIALLAPSGQLPLGRSALLASGQEQLVVESRQEKDKELTAIMNRLEELDQYFSQMARPRYGRSEFKSRPAQQLMANRHSNQPQYPQLLREQQQPIFRGPIESQQQLQRLDSLMDLINGRLAKKYSKDALSL